MKILWGPYNHSRLDLLCQEQLQAHELYSFGPHGADLICPCEATPAQAERLKQLLEDWQPDLILVLEPFLRLLSPLLWQAQSPILAISSWQHVPPKSWSLFDGVITLWHPAQLSLQQPHRQWFPLKWQDPLPFNASRLYPLTCVGSALSTEWFQVLEALDPQPQYLQGLSQAQRFTFLKRSQAVFIPSPLPSLDHFDILAAGCALLYPETAEAVTALLPDHPLIRPCSPENLHRHLPFAPPPQTHCPRLSLNSTHK